MLPADDTTALDIEDMVFDALERLPEPFRDQLGSVAIVVEDEATPEQLASVGAHGLYGLYQGIPRMSGPSWRVRTVAGVLTVTSLDGECEAYHVAAEHGPVSQTGVQQAAPSCGWVDGWRRQDGARMKMAGA